MHKGPQTKMLPVYVGSVKDLINQKNHGTLVNLQKMRFEFYLSSLPSVTPC